MAVIRDQIGEREDRFFATVFLGSGLLFLAMLFAGSVTTSTVMSLVAAQNPSAELFDYGRVTTQGLISVYALRMAAVFTLSVSTVGIRAGALPRWVSYLGYASALVLLSVLGALAAKVGGAPLWKGAVRVTFWGALAMGVSALIGRLFGTTV